MDVIFNATTGAVNITKPILLDKLMKELTDAGFDGAVSYNPKTGELEVRPNPSVAKIDFSKIISNHDGSIPLACDFCACTDILQVGKMPTAEQLGAALLMVSHAHPNQP